MCRSAVLILAAVDPYLEMSPGRFQFIILVQVGGSGGWWVVVREVRGKLFTDIGDGWAGPGLAWGHIVVGR